MKYEAILIDGPLAVYRAEDLSGFVIRYSGKTPETNHYRADEAYRVLAYLRGWNGLCADTLYSLEQIEAINEESSSEELAS